MPHRRMLALLAPAVLLTGCSVELPADAVPAPFSIAPTPSASAGVPKYVCSAVYKILTDGALRVAQQTAGDADAAALQKTFTDMAGKIDEEAARTPDAPLRSALRDISADLQAGARQADPRSYVEGDFQTVGQKLDGKCAG